MRAIWKGKLLAQNADTVVVEGNHYFSPESLKAEHFRPSRHHTVCPWKGRAGYYDVAVDGEVNPEAAWYYSDPKPDARKIKDHVAFWHGVEVTD
ncbi:MAG: DUF427 domain-containing protein [Rhodanobacteraceae bacterium]|nr:MAG: DUF427 domain-containing protein [Rhodanobacteraceae bacterium]